MRIRKIGLQSIHRNPISTLNIPVLLYLTVPIPKPNLPTSDNNTN